MATDNKVLVQRIFEEIVNQKREDVIDELLYETTWTTGPARTYMGGRRSVHL